jgi:hypothetical protein
MFLNAPSIPVQQSPVMKPREGPGPAAAAGRAPCARMLDAPLRGSSGRARRQVGLGQMAALRNLFVAAPRLPARAGGTRTSPGV